MKRILVPIDFSETSANALHYAHSLAEHLGTSLALLHCYPVQAYNRPYQFEKKDYDAGIRKMLMDFYTEHVGRDQGKISFLAQPGSISETVALISKQYQVIILSGNKLSGKVSRWLGSKVTYIASKAQCPVLIIPASEHFPFKPWQKIRHIQRKEKEKEIIEKKLSDLKIVPEQIEVKPFDQPAFQSTFWRTLATYLHLPWEKKHQEIFETTQMESVDLLLMVSHRQDTFERFVKNQAVQVIFKYKIPLLIFQA